MHTSKLSVLLTGLVLVAAFLTACDDKNPSPTPPPSTQVSQQQTPVVTPSPRILSATASVRANNALIVDVAITLDREANVYLEYEHPLTGKFRTATTTQIAKQHTVPVVRLRASTTYSYHAFATDSQGRKSEGTGGVFSTGALPEALASIKFDATGRPTPDLVLLDHRDVDGSYILALDSDSNIVWYYGSPNPVPGVPYAMQTVRQKANYNLVYYLGNPPLPCCLREITPLGEIVDNLSYSSFDGVPHHDHLILPDNKVLYLAWTYRIIPGGATEKLVEGDSLRVWDQNSHTTYEIWNSFDTLPEGQRGEWKPRAVTGVKGAVLPRTVTSTPPLRTFANSLQIGPRGDYIVSIIDQPTQVISIDPDLRSIEWVLGGPDSTIAFRDPRDRFYRQHSVSELSNGNILVFDNGQGRPKEEGGEYSRVIELAISDYDLKATRAWEYRPQPDIFGRARGSAIRLNNGNTLVNFDVNPRVVVEVSRKGAEVWKLVMTGPRLQGSYRAYPFNSIMGESPVR